MKVVVDDMRQLSALALPSGDRAAARRLPVAAVGAITSAARTLPTRAARWQHLLGSPLVVAWLVAGTVALMFIIAVWPERAGRDVPDVAMGRLDASQPDESPTVVPSRTDDGSSTDDATRSAMPVAAEPPVEAPRPSPAAAAPAIQLAIVEPVIAEKPQVDSEAVVDPPPEPAPPVDVTAALGQPIVRFDQSRPAAFRDLLLLLDEMTGVPIVYDNIDAAVMAAAFETRVSLTLDRTTVGEILERVLGRVGLRFEIESDTIRLHPRAKDEPAG